MKKRMISAILLVILLFCFAFTAAAEQPSDIAGYRTMVQAAVQKNDDTVTKNGLKFNVYSNGNFALVVGPVKKTIVTVVIPATIKVSGTVYDVIGIGFEAFKNLKKLKSVTIGKNIATIGDQAFYGCSKLKAITIKGNKFQERYIEVGAFKGIPKTATVYCPKKCLKAYRKLLRAKGLPKAVTVTTK